MTNARRVLILFALLAIGACSPAHREPEVMRARAEAIQVAAAGDRHAINTVILSRSGPVAGQNRYYFGGVDAARISLDFVVRDRSRMFVAAECDGRARFFAPDAIDDTVTWNAAGSTVRFELAPAERHLSRIELGTEATRCTLTVTPGGHRPYTLDLHREELALPRIAAIDRPQPACTAAQGADPLVRAFMASGEMATSCPVATGTTRMLSVGLDGLNAKIEALTGRRVSEARLLDGDPQMPLDWSNAPQLDLIYLNYLNLNADFSGALMARMLEWHAARGTIVRILVSEVMLTETDRALFEGLAARYATVQLQNYRFPAEATEGGGLDAQLGRLHRVTHVKLFATIARDPGRSTAMIGGRNLHDGYFFETPRDLSAFPDLHQYDPDQTKLTGGFAAYEDFEIEFRSDPAVRSIVGHMAALWHRDHDRQVPRPAQGTRSIGTVGEGQMRHFISVPFADAEAQEAYFIGLIDAAERSIHIAIPYLNMPENIDAALNRARDRGVSVQVVTTVRVREATDFVVTGLNRQFANDFGEWVAFYDYDPVPRLLHSKLFVFDGRLSVVTSSNLNMRSFVHDLENGVVILDRAVAARIDAVIQGYVRDARRVLPGQEVPRLVQWLRRIGTVTRAF